MLLVAVGWLSREHFLQAPWCNSLWKMTAVINCLKCIVAALLLTQLVTSES